MITALIYAEKELEEKLNAAVSQEGEKVGFLCIGSLSELKIHAASNWKCNLLEEMCKSFLSESCMKVGSLWKWESSPRAGEGTAHDNRRKEMSPIQIK